MSLLSWQISLLCCFLFWHIQKSSTAGIGVLDFYICSPICHNFQKPSPVLLDIPAVSNSRHPAVGLIGTMSYREARLPAPRCRARETGRQQQERFASIHILFLKVPSGARRGRDSSQHRAPSSDHKCSKQHTPSWLVWESVWLKPSLCRLSLG